VWFYAIVLDFEKFKFDSECPGDPAEVYYWWFGEDGTIKYEL
jgi:hypothetical protein